MKWQDRQGTSNMQDRRSTMTGDPVVDEMQKKMNSLDALLVELENPDVAPLPHRRRMQMPGGEKIYQGAMDRLNETQQDTNVQLPIPRPKVRRYPNDQK